MKKVCRLVFAFFVASFIFVSKSVDSKAEKIVINHDVSQGVNVRKEKSDDSEILGGIDYQDYYEIKDEDENWYKITYKGQNGYVGKKWFLKLLDYKLDRNTKLKKSNSSKSKTIEKLKKNEYVTLLEVYSNDFAKVFYKDKIAYISFRDLELYKMKYKDQDRHKNSIKKTNKILGKYENFGDNEEYEAKDGNFIKKRVEEDENAVEFIDQEIIYDVFEVTGDGADIYWYASNFLGNPYVFGGNDLIKGIDCSGFCQQVYREFGIGLPRIAQDQYYIGKEIKLGNEQAGDLVFYGNGPNSISHVAIADGNGGIIHASNPRTGIITSYIGNPIGIKRILE